jgi:hypothetical protein
MKPFATLSAAAIALVIGFSGAASAQGATDPLLLKRGQETHETAAPAKAQEQGRPMQTAPGQVKAETKGASTGKGEGKKEVRKQAETTPATKTQTAKEPAKAHAAAKGACKPGAGKDTCARKIN